MFPAFNPRPYPNSQLQNNGTPASTPQQVMGNPASFLQNPMNVLPQMGMFNPQIPMPNSNPSTHFVPGQLAPFQNPNLNNPMAINQMSNNNNLAQSMGHIFLPNSMNPSQVISQNMGLAAPNGMWGLQNPMQNVNQLMQMQIPNFPQVVPGNFILGPNQVSPGGMMQNPAFAMNPQFGSMQFTGGMHQPVIGNSAKQLPISAQQLQGNSAPSNALAPNQPQQNQNNCNPAVSANSQGNGGNFDRFRKGNGTWKGSQSRNFTRNANADASSSGPMKIQSRHSQNTRGNFRTWKQQGGIGRNNTGAENSGNNSTNQTRGGNLRSLPLNYTEQEVKQWREERRKNYPSKANLDKKGPQKLTEPGVTDSAAKLRRQQLKEILAKQAELGCEVAEIPPCYLSDSEKQDHRREDNRRQSKRGRFQNKFNKKGRFQPNERFSKNQRSHNPDSPNTNNQNNRFTKKQRLTNDSATRGAIIPKREPTLLQKLLSADIRRDKHYLRQAFRFMTMNSFFKDWPQRPLKFPTVIVKETAGEASEIVEEKPMHYDEFDDNDTSCGNRDTVKFDVNKNDGIDGREVSQQEEGEITD